MTKQQTQREKYLVELLSKQLSDKICNVLQDYLDTVCVTGTGVVKLSPEEIEHERKIYNEHIMSGGHSGIYGDF